MARLYCFTVIVMQRRDTILALLKMYRLLKLNGTDFRVCSQRFSAAGRLRAYYERTSPESTASGRSELQEAFNLLKPKLNLSKIHRE